MRTAWFAALLCSLSCAFAALNALPAARAEEAPGPAATYRSVETQWEIDVSRDGRFVAAASAHGQVRVLAADDLRVVWETKTGKDPVQSVSFSHDGALVAYGDATGTVAILDAKTGKETWRLPKLSSAGRVRFSPAALLLAVSGAPESDYKKTCVELWDVAEKRLHKKLVQSTNARYSPGDLSFSRDGARLAVAIANKGKGVELLDVKSGKRRMRIAQKKDVTGVAFSPDGKLLGSAGIDGRVTLWNVEKTKAKKLWSEPFRDDEVAYVNGLDFSADGIMLAAVGRGSGPPIRLYTADDGRARMEVGTSNPVGNAVRFAPNGRSVFAAFTTYGDIAKVGVVQRFAR